VTRYTRDNGREVWLPKLTVVFSPPNRLIAPARDQVMNRRFFAEYFLEWHVYTAIHHHRVYRSMLFRCILSPSMAAILALMQDPILPESSPIYAAHGSDT
jgi:hypothetical protein